MVVGTVHEYTTKKVAFEFNGTNPTHLAQNVVLFIGGLTDGLLTVPYLPYLAEKVSEIDHNGDWVLIQGLLSSAYTGFGTSSLEQDNLEIGKLVSYLRSEKGGSRRKIVLMGHSTGCQDTIRYLSKYSYSSDFDQSQAIDAGILQAPVSDHEALSYIEGKDLMDSLVKEVEEEYISKGLETTVLPPKFTKVSFGVSITAYRFYSLFLKFGDDDYFSTYIPDETLKETFGKVTKPLLSIYGAEDEFVPPEVDRQGLINRWKNQTDPKVWSDLSRVLEGASHAVADTEVAKELVDIVVKFVYSL